jgi:hypothetical protein
MLEHVPAEATRLIDHWLNSEPLILQRLAIHVVVRHQQPTDATLLHPMVHVARCRLNHLTDDDLQVATHQRAQRRSFGKGASKGFHTEPLSIGVRHLHDSLAQRDRVVPEKRFDADETIIANGRRFYYGTVRQHRRQGTDPTVQEVDMPQSFARLMKHLFAANRNCFQMRTKMMKILVGK